MITRRMNLRSGRCPEHKNGWAGRKHFHARRDASLFA
jgi:hypothetical protein